MKHYNYKELINMVLDGMNQLNHGGVASNGLNFVTRNGWWVPVTFCELDWSARNDEDNDDIVIVFHDCNNTHKFYECDQNSFWCVMTDEELYEFKSKFCC